MIDKKINNALIEKFSPKDSSLRTHQERMLEMLVHIDKICKENNIKYWLSSGTLLGAIRHEGFIPWDDDVDIEMLREDYLKLEKILIKDNIYNLQTRKTDPYYVVSYAKLRDKKSVISEHGQDVKYMLRGVYIDIFILEKSHFLSSKITGALTWRVLLLGAKLDGAKALIFFFFKKLLYLIIPIVRIIDSLIPYRELRHTYGSGFSKNIRKEKEIFPIIETKFENHSFSIPSNYDKYLERLYGDYMKLPNLNNITPHITDIKFL